MYPEEREIKCFRCNCRMRFLEGEYIQLGKAGSMFGLASALETDIYYCPRCKKVEFFLSEDESRKLPYYSEKESVAFAEGEEFSDSGEELNIPRNKDGIPQRQCPNCGKLHDFDYPKCPFCKIIYE